jgi:hypothetical protein
LIIVQKNTFYNYNNFLITTVTGLSGFQKSESLISQSTDVIDYSFDQWFKKLIEWCAYFFKYCYR